MRISKPGKLAAALPGKAGAGGEDLSGKGTQGRADAVDEQGAQALFHVPASHAAACAGGPACTRRGAPRGRATPPLQQDDPQQLLHDGA
eukprot:CAMPEP_0176238644 /NCGR_PEP_ID=MMETSP0121_2-20121125/28469_1 /TAXON_ID=160619 /ORGANISM="Kryptoperidinium foliaceum, Strain CCMP 1326" /LENGTH=88 /DNA_ID=CAMNT_0017578121 /DNA_START=203 /DNA_END=469 /DNA_ORIENTATION=-